MPTSPATVSTWLKDLFQEQKQHVIGLFETADTRLVNFSFDLWKGPNHRYYLGLVAHWYDSSAKKVRHVLIALHNLPGRHSGENQGILLWNILVEFGLAEKLGWFTLDSGAYNGTTLAWLGETLRRERGWYFDAKERYIRCFGHTLNLIVEAFLIGTHYTDLKKAINEIEKERGNIQDSTQSSATRQAEFQVQEDREMAIWRKTGALGKLRNIIVWITRSHNRRESFIKSVQKCKQVSYPLLLSFAFYYRIILISCTCRMEEYQQS